MLLHRKLFKQDTAQPSRCYVGQQCSPQIRKALLPSSRSLVRLRSLGLGVWSTVHNRALRSHLRPPARDSSACNANGQASTTTSYACVAIQTAGAEKVSSGGFTPLETIDAFAAYSVPTWICCYFLPLDVFAGRTVIQLRLSAARNNQAGVNWAKDFEFDATLGPRGAIAQLGERLAGSQKVAGSSPAGSTDQLPILRGGSGPQRTPRPVERPPGWGTAEQR